MLFSYTSVKKFEKINVLLMDGSEHAAALLSEMFSRLGFGNIEVVHDGYEGIQSMKKKVFHLVMTNSELKVRRRRHYLDDTPEGGELESLSLSGMEFVKRLRRSPFSPNPFVSVLMVVNQNTPESMADARDAGVNGIVTKPLKAKDLCRHIISLIDDNRIFITAENYKGPCRRREEAPLPDGVANRRTRTVRLMRRADLRFPK